jgi:hypothetical protein
MGYARQAMQAGSGSYDNVIEGDFLQLGGQMTVEELKNLSIARRDQVEAAEGRRLAEKIVDLLARDDETIRRRIETGFELAARMSWEDVMEGYFLPALGRAAAH